MAETSVLITTSGIGSRLGDITEYTNKCLVRVGDKPAISYIIENYPQDTQFVVTLGYYGYHVRSFLEIAYPDKNFTFIEVDNYSGPGSSLCYSILQAKDVLQRPFIYHACDTIVQDPAPDLNNNWCAGFKKGLGSQYRSLNVVNNCVTKINDKGEIHYDFDYIGLCGIRDYELFWQKIEELYVTDHLDSQLSDCDVINLMLETVSFRHMEFKNWLDIGNVDSLETARSKVENTFDVLNKVDESIFLVENHIIKFFHNEEVCANRIFRARQLEGLTPSIASYKDNFYKYKYVEGELCATIANRSNFNELLNWASNNLWKPNSKKDISNLCENFYFEKTYKRINDFFNKTNDHDKTTTINNLVMPPVFEMIKKIDKEWLCNAKPYQFHGDFILDNIIKTKEGYCLLDWRQDFGGDLKSGDIYYDLAKLNHNLVLNHENIKNNHFTIENHNGKITCDVLINFRLLECQKTFQSFLIKNNFDIGKVEVLTSLIWLNMSALHEHPLDKFLFYFGKYNLAVSLRELQNEIRQ